MDKALLEKILKHDNYVEYIWLPENASVHPDTREVKYSHCNSTAGEFVGYVPVYEIKKAFTQNNILMREVKMDKFEIKSIDHNTVIRYDYHYCRSDNVWEYTFYNTTIVDRFTVKSSNDYTHHDHPLMVLLELQGDLNDIFWQNDSKTVKLFEQICKGVLDNQDYFKPMFKACTEYVINESLKSINNLIDYTDYWVGD